MIAKGARPFGSPPQTKHRGSLTPTKDGVSSFAFDLRGLQISSDVVIEFRGNVAPYLFHAGDVARSLLGARIVR